MEGEAKLETVVVGAAEVAGAAADAAVNATAAVAQRAAALARLLGWDEALLLGMRRWHAPSRTRIAHAFTTAGDARTWGGLGALLLGFGLATGKRGVCHLSLRLGAGAVLATVASQALKRTLGRRRPTSAIEGFTALAENPDAFSFPSGHTSAAFGVAIALQNEPHGAGPLSLLLAAGIGLSRVYLGAHYPLDVIVGALVGSATGGLARLVVP